MTRTGAVVLGFYGAALAAAILLVPIEAATLRVGMIIGLSVLLVAVCYWKGEAPRWSWGPENKENNSESAPE